MFRFLTGKFLELIGLLTLPFGLYFGHVMNSMAVEFGALAGGAMLFTAGWMLEKSVKT